jgi:hypothetical protein
VLAAGIWCRRRRPYIAATIVPTAVRPLFYSVRGRKGSHAIGRLLHPAEGLSAIGRSSPWMRRRPKRRNKVARQMQGPLESGLLGFAVHGKPAIRVAIP